MFFQFSKLIKEDYGKTDWQWFYNFFQNLFLDRKFLTKNWRNCIIDLIWGFPGNHESFNSPLSHCHIYA